MDGDYPEGGGDVTENPSAWRAAQLIGLAAVAFLSVMVVHVAIRSSRALPARMRTVPLCTERELLAAAPQPVEVDSHRLFQLPTIIYSSGAFPDFDYGSEFDLPLRIDGSGRVVCYGRMGRFDEPLQFTDQRRAILSALHDWKYVPFLRDGKATAAIVVEHVNEEIAPLRFVEMPQVAPERAQIRLRRSGCFGTCPIYGVELFGDGSAVYDGRGYVDVVGVHHFRVDPALVAGLIASAKAKDLWSLRPVYRSGVTDLATYEVMITLGDEVHTIEDYVGESVGMPHAVRVFEQEIDQAAQSDAWIHLAGPALVHLREEHFPFQSEAGGELFRRANADEESRDDQAILQLLNLGVPSSISAAPGDHGTARISGTALENALENRRAVVVDALIAEGALRAGSRIDQTRLDAAFRSAIRGGRLDVTFP
ncbi:MAG TPA: DUF6438 domain-containing protein [Steroidobacteraceae bacterium]|nr:DUF6438 domain-containing protein [Steroidobacteraceae bacterium]